MKLFLMRHGPAEDTSETGRDFDRPLSLSGRERVRLVARELLEKRELPKRIVSSPLLRAMETAEIMRATFGLEGDIEEDDELVPGGNGQSVVRSLLNEGAESVLLVSHEPSTSYLAAQLLPGWGRAFETAMVLGVEMRPQAATKRRFLLEPRTLSWKLG